MELNYFIDILFDVINESDEMDIADISSNDMRNGFLVKVQDGTIFNITVCVE